MSLAILSMNTLLQNLLRLQAIDFGESAEELSERALAELRGSIPEPIRGHYDRLVARGKKGVALVRNQVCTGCHMRVPIGTINTLMHARDIQLCGSCGRYLCLAEIAQAIEPAPAPASPPKKARKRKTPQKSEPSTTASA